MLMSCFSHLQEAKRALQEAKRASGRAVGARSEDFRGPIDVDMDDDFEFDIDQRDRGGAGAGMPSNVFGGFNVREIARRVDALASQPGAEGKTAEGSPVVDEEPPGLSISDLASAFAKLFSLASPSMHGTLFLRGLYALDHHPMFFRQGSSNKVKAAREFLGQLPL